MRAVALLAVSVAGICTLQAQAPVDFLPEIRTVDEFDVLSRASERAGEVERTTKFLLPASNDPSLLPPVFQNVNRYAFHVEFLTAVFPDKFPALSFEQYLSLVERRASRKYYAGSLSRINTGLGTLYGFTVFSDQKDPVEILTVDETRAVYFALQAVFGLTPLYYAPDTQPARVKAQEWMSPGFPVYLGSGTEARYQGYTFATGYGRVRLMTLDDFDDANDNGRITWQDILVLERAPSDIEGVVAGVITGEPQGELSHVAIRTARRKTPNAFLSGALLDLKPLEGKLVRLVVGATEYSAVETTLEEAEAWWKAHRPSLSEAPRLDADYAQLDSVDEMDLSGAPFPAEARFGGKASNFARLQRILTGPFEKYREPAFAVPIHYYFEFLRANKAESPFQPGVQVTYEEYLQELFASTDFQSDSEARFEALKRFRTTVEDYGNVDSDLVARLIARIEQIFGSKDTAVRFRSSSNIEDALEFNGAGLYDSTTACAADELDNDNNGPSLCDANQPRERRISRALKLVWASLWTFRAFEEREYYGIPQDLCGMGVFVSTAFLDEKVNGVAFTGNPANFHDRRYVVTAQAGEESVVSPEPGKTAEKDILEVEAGAVTRIDRVQRSSLVPVGENVIGDDGLRELGAFLWHVDRNLSVELGGHQRNEVLFDLEFKFEADGTLAVKQVRPFLVSNTEPRGPTFELVVPPGAAACGVFLDGRDPRLEYESKSRIRFAPGAHPLPSDTPSFPGSLIHELLYGPNQARALPFEPGRFRVTTEADGRGNVTYRYEYQETFKLPDGKEIEVQLSFLDFEVRRGQAPILLKTFDEELITNRLALLAVPGGDRNRLVRYSSCLYETIPLWHGRADLEGGDTVSFEERFDLPLAGSGPGSLVAARVTINGVEREVRDYWRLVYAAQHHNVHVSYWVVLDPPLALPDGKEVHVVELEEPQADTRRPAQAGFLDRNHAVLGRPRVLCWKKALDGEELGSCGFRRGDTDASGSVNLTDALYLLLHLFASGPTLKCADTGDFDDDGVADFTDAVLILTFLFRGADVSGPPGPYGCGVDPTQDGLAECGDGGCG